MLKLLPKSEIEKAKAGDRQREIDEGMKLAKKVDTLREVAAQEEASLTRFRRETVTAIQAEIDAKIAEREREEAKAKEARARRMAEEAPFNLKKEWERIQGEGMANEQLRDELLAIEIRLITRENEVTDAKKELTKREKDVLEQEDWTRRALLEAERANQEAQDDRTQARSAKEKARKSALEQQLLFDAKEREFMTRESVLASREKQMEEDIADIISQKKFLADQRQTLERGFAELRRKQQN